MTAWLFPLLLLAAEDGEWVPLDEIGPNATPVEETAEAEPDPTVPESDALLNDPDVNMSIIVVSEAELREARDNLVRRFGELGWRSKRKSDGRIIFRGPQSWMGKATLYPDGYIDWDTPAVASFDTAKNNPGYGNFEALDPNAGSDTVGVSMAPFPGGKKTRAAQSVVMEQIRPQVEKYEAALQARAFTVQLEELPGRLDRLWVEGVSMSGGPLLEGAVARRTAVLDYWATRAPTPEGRAVMVVVERWIRGTLSGTTDAVTDSEKAQAESRRDDDAKLRI